MKWISVKDRLPEYDSRFLALWSDGNINVIRYWACEWEYLSKRIDSRTNGSIVITHWAEIELPEDIK